MDTDKLFQSKLFKGITLGLAGLIVFIFIFGLGVYVGTKRADFSFRWAEAYHTNFGGPQGGFLGDIKGDEFTNSNGAFGQIIKINPPIDTLTTLTIKGRDSVEKNILVNDNTTIVFQKKNIKLSELKNDDDIVVIGEPDENGQIEAKLIRVMPAPRKGLPAK